MKNGEDTQKRSYRNLISITNHQDRILDKLSMVTKIPVATVMSMLVEAKLKNNKFKNDFIQKYISMSRVVHLRSYKDKGLGKKRCVKRCISYNKKSKETITMLSSHTDIKKATVIYLILEECLSSSYELNKFQTQYSMRDAHRVIFANDYIQGIVF